MRVFWFHSGLMPEACEALGYEKRNTCGWLESMLHALIQLDSSIEFCLLGWDWRSCDIQIGRVRHVSFGYAGPTWYDRIPAVLSCKAKQLIAAFSPDIIHIQGTEYFYGCFDKSVYGNRPVVVSLQGVISGLYTHYNGGLLPDELKGTNWNARYIIKGQNVFSEQRMWRDKRAWQEQKVLRQQHNFIGRTLWDKAWVEYVNPQARYYKVNENLRPQFFSVQREASGIKRRSIYCGAAASCALKGAHWLIRAVASLKSEFPDIELRIAAADRLKPPKDMKALLLVQSYHTYIRHLIKRLNIEQNVVALPELTAQEVAEELCRAELFVLPSLCENSPNSLCEAMVVGTPAIATFVGGIPSMLEDGVEGKLVPSGDPAALAGAIRRWFLHPEEAEACVKRAHQKALARHNSMTNAKATLAVYKEMIRK